MTGLRLDAGGRDVAAVVDGSRRLRGPAVLLTHGAGGDLHGRGLRGLAEGLGERGHLVVRANLPYREAGARTPPAAERSAAAFRALATDARVRLAPRRAWVVGGRSYGGRVASLAVADGLPAAGLLLYSYPLHRPGGGPARTLHWGAIEVPCLFLQGTHDPFCDLAVLHREVARLGGDATVHVVEGGDHSLAIARRRSTDGHARGEEVVARELASVAGDWIRTIR